MNSHTYYLVDVFTDQKFGGNPLAVFPDGHLVPEDKMQVIAKEFNLSETTFVLPPEDKTNDYKVRIFTPMEEIPMAGHPTVGTSFVLTHINEKLGSNGDFTLRLEEKVGLIPVDISFDNDKIDVITMMQPNPTFMDICENCELAASALGLSSSDLVPNLPCQVISTGFPFLFIPLNSRKAIETAKINSNALEKLIKEFGNYAIYLFDTDMKDSKNDVHGRMFAPHHGIPEDPATGGANGPLGSYLVKHKVLKPGKFISEQGFEMGRPSFINIEIEEKDEIISKVMVGGKSVLVGKGEIYL